MDIGYSSVEEVLLDDFMEEIEEDVLQDYDDLGMAIDILDDADPEDFLNDNEEEEWYEDDTDGNLIDILMGDNFKPKK